MITFAPRSPATWANLQGRSTPVIYIPPLGEESEPFDANVLVDFESGTAGDAVDTTYLTANDRGTPENPWATSGAGTVVLAADNQALLSPAIIDATEYTGEGTRCARFDLATGFRGFNFQLTGGPYTRDVTIAAWFKTNMPADGSSNGEFDFITLENSGGGGSEWAVAQFRGDTYNLHAHSSQGTDPVGITLQPDIWYWVVLKYQQTGTRGCYISVYDTNGDLFGESFLGFGASTEGVRFIAFGNTNPHGLAPIGYAFFDNVVVDYDDATFPIGDGSPGSDPGFELQAILAEDGNPILAENDNQIFADDHND